MTVHELNDVMAHWQNWEDRDYEIFLWDPYRQRQIEFTFCGCSHPDKIVNFTVTGYKNHDPLWKRIKNKLFLKKLHLSYKVRTLLKSPRRCLSFGEQ